MSAAAQARTDHAHLELMETMGASRYDPMPPELMLAPLRNAYRAKYLRRERLFAWLCQKTIHYQHGKKNKRSGFASDDRGTLNLLHAAVDNGWTPPKAHALWRELESFQVVRRDEKGRLWLVGEPAKTLPPDPPADVEKPCTGNLPEYLTQQIQQLPKDQRESALTKWRLNKEMGKRLRADAAAASRAVEEDWDKAWAEEFQLKLRVGKKVATGDRLAALQLYPDVLENSVQGIREALAATQNASTKNPVQGISGTPETDEKFPVQGFSSNAVQDQNGMLYGKKDNAVQGSSTYSLKAPEERAQSSSSDRMTRSGAMGLAVGSNPERTMKTISGKAGNASRVPETPRTEQPAVRKRGDLAQIWRQAEGWSPGELQRIWDAMETRIEVDPESVVRLANRCRAQRTNVSVAEITAAIHHKMPVVQRHDVVQPIAYLIEAVVKHVEFAPRQPVAGPPESVDLPPPDTIESLARDIASDRRFLEEFRGTVHEAGGQASLNRHLVKLERLKRGHSGTGTDMPAEGITEAANRGDPEADD